MKTIEELKEQHAKELEALELEQTIRASLPLEPKHVCLHKGFASATYGKQFPSRYSFKEAYAIYRQFTPAESEHWKNGCLSVRPAEINDYAKDERAVMQGTSIAEIKLQAGKGYDSHELSFWTRIDGRLLQISIELQPEAKWLPYCDFRYDTHGNCTVSVVNSTCIGEDKKRKWWSPEGSYQISYYWADVPNFRAFASQFLPESDL